MAGWPVARQHPRGKSGTVFVTVEDETGDIQLILWPRVFARVQEGAGKPVAGGSWHGFPLGRDHERHRLPVGAPCDAGSAAARARLALDGPAQTQRSQTTPYSFSSAPRKPINRGFHAALPQLLTGSAGPTTVWKQRLSRLEPPPES